MGKINQRFMCFLAIVVLALIPSQQASAKETIYNSPYVTFSPDGQAWTTNAGVREVEQYDSGSRVITGIASSLRELEKGEHYYKTKRTGEVPIGYWMVEHAPAQCIHNHYLQEGLTYHGISFGRKICYARYFSGWAGYCADCGNVAARFVYMSKNAAKSIDYLPADMEYYYTCPFCMNLEQGTFFSHLCKRISANRYKVRFLPGAPGVAGYMEDEMYLYDNASCYEGEEVSVRSNLPKNRFQRTGYSFAGWNTRPDGSGEFFADEQEILNLTSENWQLGSDAGIVTLYAMWQPAISKLQIDPAGGTYLGKKSKTTLQGGYGEKIALQMEGLTAPKGYTVKFDVQGGNAIEPVTSSRSFVCWSKSESFQGLLKGNDYYFKGEQGHTDVLTATYRTESILLPAGVREGYLFGGWYYDRKCTRYAGKEGDTLTPTKALTLYACWVDLSLQAEDNYRVLDGTGAVDLFWNTAPVENSMFRVLQSRDGIEWTALKEQGKEGQYEDLKLQMNSVKATKVVIPRTGLYRLEAAGGRGGSIGKNHGGDGGIVSASFWLQKGEILTVSCGAAGSSEGADKSTGGGASRIVSDQQGVLLIAGGGGGATQFSDGGDGGSVRGLRGDGNSQGESGQAGGGEGMIGGIAGTVRYHSHANCDAHNHTEACYTKHKHQDTCYEYYEKREGNSPIDRKPCGCQVQEHYHRCSKCGDTWTSITYNSAFCKEKHYDNSVRNLNVKECHAPERICGLEEKEYLSCTIPEGYFCGKQEDEVEEVISAGGGSNYCNPVASYEELDQIGGNAGGGYARITESFSGLQGTMELIGAAARDMDPPEKPAAETLEFAKLQKDGKRIFWGTPEDHGTLYYHQVELYCKENAASPKLISNRTENTLISQVKGYYVRVDQNPATKITRKNATFTSHSYWDVEQPKEKNAERYLHIAAVDRADNISETLHVDLEHFSGPEKENDTPPTLLTDPLKMTAGENTWHVDTNRWYVRADGKTPFTVTLSGNSISEETVTAVICGALNYIGDSKVDRLQWQIPAETEEAGDRRIDLNRVIKTVDADFPAKQGMYLKIQTSVYGQRLTAEQGLLLEKRQQGSWMEIFPSVGAEYDGEMLWSEQMQDRKNGLQIIGDGEAPTVYGMGLLQGRDATAFRTGQETLHLWAEDLLSGVSSLSLRVYNVDNTCEQLFEGDAQGHLYVTADPTQPLWNGKLNITVEAKDRVGNVFSKEFVLSGLGLTLRLERVLEPHTPIFKGGEAGKLFIAVTGETNRLEILFPREMTSLNPNLNQVLTYPVLTPETREEILFFVPLYTPGGNHYSVTVRAYSPDGAFTEGTALFSVVDEEGGIPAELRTRIR